MATDGQHQVGRCFRRLIVDMGNHVACVEDTGSGRAMNDAINADTGRSAKSFAMPQIIGADSEKPILDFSAFAEQLHSSSKAVIDGNRVACGLFVTIQCGHGRIEADHFTLKVQ